jgi:ribosomal protein S18 acetylase RimI-like enzyme
MPDMMKSDRGFAKRATTGKKMDQVRRALAFASENNMRQWFLGIVEAIGGEIRHAGDVHWGYSAKPLALSGTDRIIPFPASGGGGAEEIAEAAAYFRAKRVRPWCTCGGVMTSEALRRSLKWNGIDFSFAGICMATDLVETPPFEPVPLEFEIRPIHDLDPESLVAHPSHGALDKEPALNSTRAEFALGRADPRRAQSFGLFIDGRLVGSSMLFVKDGIAGIYNVATLPEFRRRHGALAVVDAALREARRMGIATAVLQTSLAMGSLYARLGFETVSRFDHWIGDESFETGDQPTGGDESIDAEMCMIKAAGGQFEEALAAIARDPGLAHARLPGAAGGTLLHLASYHGLGELVQPLIDAGADLNARDTVYDGTPFGWATTGLAKDGPVFKRDQYKIAKLLLAAGAEPPEDQLEWFANYERDAVGQR